MRQELSARGITKIRAHEARAEHKPDFGNTPANGLYAVLKSMQP